MFENKEGLLGKWYSQDGESVYDCGDRVYRIEQGFELRTYVYAYDVATGYSSGGYLGENCWAYDLDKGFAVCAEHGKGNLYGVNFYYNFNPGMAEPSVLICYQFQNNEALVCPDWGEEWIETSPESKIPIGNYAGYDLRQWDGYGLHPTTWTTNYFEMLIHEPSKNGIATYEIICTTIHWKSNGLCNWDPEYEESIVGIDLPKTIAYGYIGLGCDYFVQPLFPEAKGFDGDRAQVRIGDKWLSMTAEEIAEYDPFIQPSEIKETTVE